MAEHAYGAAFSELYDTFYSEKDYSAEAEFLAIQADGLFSASAEPRHLLDIACGTGEHMAAFARQGYRVVGIDISPSMLKRVHSKSLKTEERAFLIQADMKSLPIKSGTFDIAVSLFDSIGYSVTVANVGKTLCEVARVLKRGGLAAIEFWHAPAMLKFYDPVKVRRFETVGGSVTRLSETAIDTEASVATVTFTTFIPTSTEDARYHQVVERHRNRFFTVNEMKALLSRASLEPLRWFPGFTTGDITAETFHVLVLARHG